ncbi:alpha/beta hydrolase [Clostridium sp. LP20]|uniref:alpha/beta hydrolase n=1 Tax=Clostridium sp. LP20 TaxID=3418665 RepID=UPI003EE78390
MGVLIVILAILLVLALLFLHYASEYAFKKAFHDNKKSKEDAFRVLKSREMLDEKIYDEVYMEEVSILSKDGLKLRGALIENFKDSNRFIILVHGYSANRHIHMPFVRLFIKEGFNILIVDERNHGDSEGEYPSYGYYEKEDLDRWIDFIVKRRGDNLFLGLHGQSMGGSTVLMCGASNPRVKFVIDDCGYSSGKEIIKYQFSKVKWVPFEIVYKVLNYKVKKRYGFRFEEVSPIEDICNSEVPVLFIHETKINQCLMRWQ